MFSAALNLAPAAASSMATAARGVAGGSSTGSTSGGLGGGLGGMSFMSPLTDAKNTMEKRLGTLAGTSNKPEAASDTKNKMTGVTGIPQGMHPGSTVKSNVGSTIPPSGTQQYHRGGLPISAPSTASLRQQGVPIQTNSLNLANNANELQYREQSQSNVMNVLNATISTSQRNFNALLPASSNQPLSTATDGLTSCSNINAQSKRCRFATTTLSSGNEISGVPQVGQGDQQLPNNFRDFYHDASSAALRQQTENANISSAPRRSRSPGPKQTPHLLSSTGFSISRNSPHHNRQKISKNSNNALLQPAQPNVSSTNASSLAGNSVVTLSAMPAASTSSQAYATKHGINKPCDIVTAVSANSNINSNRNNDTMRLKKEGIKFNAPLMMEQAEELMVLASTGKPLPEGLQIKEQLPQQPHGGTMYLIRTSDPSGKDANGISKDGYCWVEILYQADLATPRGNSMDYRHYYIGVPQASGRAQTSSMKMRTSSRFRREAYTLGNLTLFAYIGDEREGSSIHNTGSRAISIAVTQGGGDLFNSLPRSHCYDEMLVSGGTSLLSTSNQLRKIGDQGSTKTNLYGSTIVVGSNEQGSSSFKGITPTTLRPRSLDRAEILQQRKNQLSHAHLDDLDLHRLQARALSAADTNNAGINSLYGTAQSSSIISSALRSSTMLAKTNSYQGNTKSIYEELTNLSEELAGGKLVKNLTLFPSIQITLVHPDMTREFEQSCQVLYADHPDPSYLGLDEGILLFYDITFPLGRIHATLLTYINCCYEGNPVMPLAVNLHERKFKSSHQLFWARIVGDIPALQKYRFPLMIDDAEPAVHLAVRTQAPNLVQLEGWTHRFRDIDRHLRSKGYGEEAVSYYKACIGYLLSANSKQAMHDRYRKEFECVWPKDFVHYYRNKLLPRSGRLGRWAMAKMNIKEQQYFSPHTNPQERFHMLCRNFSGWETLSIDQLVRCFYLLFVFFVSETTTGSGSSSSAYVIKSTFRPHFLQVAPSFNRIQSHYPTNTLHPADIRQYVLSNFPKQTSSISLLPRQFDPLRQFYLTASAAEHGGINHHAGIEDVLQLGDALENMFYDDEDNDPLYHHAHNMSTNDIDSVGIDVSLSNLLTSHRLGNSATNRNNTARFLSNGSLPSSVIGNFNTSPYTRHQQVPSPAPNGRVPSPAPADVAYTLPSSDKFQQADFTGNVAIDVPNNGISVIPLRPTHSSLSTIPEVPAELHRSSNAINVIKTNNNNIQQQLFNVSSSIPGSMSNTGSLLNTQQNSFPSYPQHRRTLYQQSSRDNPMMSKTIGGGIIRGVHPSVDKHRNPNLPHPVVPTCQHPDMLNHYPPDILVHSTSTAVRPLPSTTNVLPTSSNNWQEQSFDSSIVTDSHYDASFESEIPPMGLSMDGGGGGVGQTIVGSNMSELMPTNQVSHGVIMMPNSSSISNTMPLTTTSHQRSQKNVFQQRKGAGLPQSSLANNAHSELGSNVKGSGVFDIAGFGNSVGEKSSQAKMLQTTKQGISGNKRSTSDVTVTNSSSSNYPTNISVGSSTSNVAPNSLMLWKKVQQYVVVGGSFVAAAQASSVEGNSQAQSNLQQHHGNTVLSKSNQSSLHH